MGLLAATHVGSRTLINAGPISRGQARPICYWRCGPAPVTQRQTCAAWEGKVAAAMRLMSYQVIDELTKGTRNGLTRAEITVFHKNLRDPGRTHNRKATGELRALLHHSDGAAALSGRWPEVYVLVNLTLDERRRGKKTTRQGWNAASGGRARPCDELSVLVIDSGLRFVEVVAVERYQHLR